MLQENADLFRRALEMAAADPMIDMVILDRYVWGEDGRDPERLRQMETVGDFIIEFSRENRYGKPVVMALNASANDPSSAATAARLWSKPIVIKVITLPQSG